MTHLTADELRSVYALEGEYPSLPIEMWKNHVACDYTRKGYWEWVEYLCELTDPNNCVS
jgi:hypothetical protein